jgi:hypothetical protein
MGTPRRGESGGVTRKRWRGAVWPIRPGAPSAGWACPPGLLKNVGQSTGSSMKSTEAFTSSSLRFAKPPLGGMAPIPLIEFS